ncbi:MAG: glycosyltransferase family 39 protein, partial [Candidatus Chisholmbacteria bacterium]|nr:glycosyltransferase family 39 protein [Candidatus Chisholmbacteria bacterium]
MKFLRKFSLIHWLLIATFFKEIVFSLTTPLWHGPDEQAHFAQVQYYAEYKRQFPNDAALNTTSQEVLLTERLLGTERDDFGKNLFTHNPAFRLEYTDTTAGKYEQIIESLPQASRTTLVKKEATVYPPLFYILSAFFYFLVYPLSLIDRVFMTRLASIGMGVATIWLTYKIARLVFPKRELFAVTAATLVSFQPMFSFLTASVNSDNGMNLLFTWFLYLAVKTINERKLSLKSMISFIIVYVAGFLTKPHFVIA